MVNFYYFAGLIFAGTHTRAYFKQKPRKLDPLKFPTIRYTSLGAKKPLQPITIEVLQQSVKLQMETTQHLKDNLIAQLTKLCMAPVDQSYRQAQHITSMVVLV